MPFRYESDGIRKIVSVLSLIIDAYNEQSCTIAIDELDAGVFEYLLGRCCRHSRNQERDSLFSHRIT